MEMLFTIEQTAQRLQLHPETVRRYLVRGTLRGIKRGKLWRIPESTLLEAARPAQSRGGDRARLWVPHLPGVKARYLRVSGAERTTGYGYSIYEIEVYGSR